MTVACSKDEPVALRDVLFRGLRRGRFHFNHWVKFICVHKMLLYTVTRMSLEAVTARLPRDMLREVERLAEEMKVDRSELIRRLLDSALREKRVEEAIQAYRGGRVTLWKAAEMAGLSLREMMELAKEKKIPVSYTLEDLRRDIEYVQRKTGGEQ